MHDNLEDIQALIRGTSVLLRATSHITLIASRVIAALEKGAGPYILFAQNYLRNLVAPATPLKTYCDSATQTDPMINMRSWITYLLSNK